MAAAAAKRSKAPPAFAYPEVDPSSLPTLRQEAEHCRRCDLYRNATQTVFGEGSPDAPVVLVGEQPGDREDIAGRPFVGPAGGILNECLDEAGIDRSTCYVTNAVKHFKFEQRGKRRLHSRPNAGEVQRCAWWLAGEIATLQPRLIVALGATALYALAGRALTLSKVRGEILSVERHSVLATIHPSFLLRIRGHGDIEAERRHFIADLKVAGQFLRTME